MQDADLENRFTYHPPALGQADLYSLLRDAGLHLALVVDEATRESREKSLAVTAAEEAVFWANAALARHGGGWPDGAGPPPTPAALHDRALNRLRLLRPAGSALVTAAATDQEALASDLYRLAPRACCDAHVSGGSWAAHAHGGDGAVYVCEP